MLSKCQSPRWKHACYGMLDFGLVPMGHARYISLVFGNFPVNLDSYVIVVFMCSDVRDDSIMDNNTS